MHWRRKWQPTPVFLLRESQGQRSLLGCRLWGHTESDMTDSTKQQQQQQRVPWTARTSYQSILKKTSPGCSLEGLMMKLKLQYFGHLMRMTHWKRP